MSGEPARAIADAVLYEGYILWPYRRSALKNRRRWTFGGVHPPAWSERHPDDAAAMRTQCLVETARGAGGVVAAGEVEARVRFLHIVQRRIRREAGPASGWVDELEVGGMSYLAWEEATEREVVLSPLSLARGGQVCASIAVPAGVAEETVCDADGRRAGSLVRSWEALQATVEVQAETLRPGVVRLTVGIANATPWDGDDRDEALRRTLCSTHTVLRTRQAQFVSMTDPPEALRDSARQCRNDGTWPVLVGDPGSRDTVLSSRIILEDYPRIAPESPGDLFDGGEIDQLLTLSILALTDEEKREMRASDPRAREILDRTESLSDKELMRLHGAIRDLRVVREA